MIVNVITAICLVVLISSVIYMIIGYSLKDREGRIAFIRGFKNGKCVVIYLLAIPLYCVGRIYQNLDDITVFSVFIDFFDSITNAASLVIMRFNVEDISNLIQDSIFYCLVMYLCFVLVVMNTILFWLSVAGQRFWSFKRDLEGKLTKKPLLYLLGYNEGNLITYKSDTESCKFIVGDISTEDAVTLYAKTVAYYSSTKYSNYIDKAFNKALNGAQKVTVIINTEDDETNLKLCRYIVDKIETVSTVKRINFFVKFKVYVFGNLSLKAIYDDVVSSAYGVIEYVSKHQKIAMDFIDRYPFSYFANENHIDYSTSLVKEGVDINCIMVGFGKINRQILLTSVANNQFMQQGEYGIKEKQVNYIIFDKTNSQNNKNLNHEYYRYENEFKKVNESEYLPLPEKPSNEKYHNIDIESNEFYDTIKQIAVKDNSLNFIIVSLGSDLENIDVAQKIIEKKLEWGIGNLIIFVRAKSWLKKDTLLEQEDCFFIGNESEVVYNLEKITNDKTFNMTIMRNKLYYYEKARAVKNVALTEQEIKEIDIQYLNEWFVKNTQLERESGLYCLLSLRSKLNLMGLDYVLKSEEGKALTEEEYLNIYAKNDELQTVVSSDGVELVKYDLDFKKSLRRNLAEQEHQRWNAFMLSKGVVPATKNQILNETKEVNGKTVFTNGKNYKLRRHGNITTYDGLVEFRKMIAKRDGLSEEITDVFKYDYQILDEAYDLLNEMGYKIIIKNS